MIRFFDVDKSYDNKTKALNKFNWEVKEREIHALLGHNGAGKTTSFLIANKIIPFDSGKVSIFGKSIKKLSGKEIQKIGLLTEKLKLYKELSVIETLNFFAGIFNIKEKKKRIEELISIFMLGDYLKKPVKKLSSGMYKKLALAVTVINDPDLIFFDEPFAGLDPITVKEICKIIKHYKEQKGKTIVIAFHNLFEVELVSDTITIIKNGRTLISEKTEILFKKFKLKKSFYISYIINNNEYETFVENEEKLFEKLSEIKTSNGTLISINENRLNLTDIYNKVYEEL